MTHDRRGVGVLMAFLITFVTASLSSSAGYGQSIQLRSVGSVPLDPANFTLPVSNPYFPLAPGTTYFYQAEEEDGLSRTEVSITSARKTIEGVSAVVVHDVSWLDVTDGPTVLIENTFDWFAPDNFGNVSYSENRPSNISTTATGNRSARALRVPGRPGSTAPKPG